MHPWGRLEGFFCYSVRPSLRREVSFSGAYYKPGKYYRLLVIFPDLTNTRFYSSSSCSSFLILRDAKVLFAP